MTACARSNARFTAHVLAALECCVLIGCGGNPTPYQPPLEGMFRWEDGSEPRELEGATVEFESKGAVVASSGVVGDGTFMLAKPLPAGEYRVRLQPLPTASQTLPARFKEFEKSGLTYTAPGGTATQRADFKLARK